MHQASVGVVISAQTQHIRVNLLNNRWHDPNVPCLELAVPDADLLITIWWLTGLPAPPVLPLAYLSVLKYLHEIMLEQSIANPAMRSISAGLALAILRMLEAEEGD